MRVFCQAKIYMSTIPSIRGNIIEDMRNNVVIIIIIRCVMVFIPTRFIIYVVHQCCGLMRLTMKINWFHSVCVFILYLVDNQLYRKLQVYYYYLCDYCHLITFPPHEFLWYNISTESLSISKNSRCQHHVNPFT